LPQGWWAWPVLLGDDLPPEDKTTNSLLKNPPFILREPQDERSGVPDAQSTGVERLHLTRKIEPPTCCLQIGGKGLLKSLKIWAIPPAFLETMQRQETDFKAHDPSSLTGNFRLIRIWGLERHT